MILLWFMRFGSDIYVFICMGFVLMELFDEWVYSFYNDGYLIRVGFAGGVLSELLAEFRWRFGINFLVFGICYYKLIDFNSFD